ncbi:MAG: DNA internalization-related competence protein ComEC/Rec2 [Candidatus Rokuibacteriota bacterium]
MRPWTAAPIAPVAITFAAGIALVPWTAPACAWTVWALALAAGTALVAGGRAPTVAAGCVLVAVATTATLRATPRPPAPTHVVHLALPRAARVEGRLAAPPTRWAPERTRLVVDVDRVDGRPHTGRVQIAVYGPAPAVLEGERVSVEARLRRAAGFRNPGTFDYGAHLARDDILVVATAASVAVVPGSSARWHARLRAAAVAAMTEALPPVSAALLSGLLIGERGGLPPELHDAFRRAGVYHILAVSGFNVALLAGAVWTMLAVAGVRRRLAALGAMAAVLVFAAVVGAEPSVIRATIMAVLVLAALVLGREASVMNSLALAALAILAVRPGDLGDPGFQLSFAATAGIVAAPLPRGPVLGALAVSAAAQLAVLPVTLAHFNQLSTLGLLANLGVVPLAGIATVLGLLAVALALVAPPLSVPFFAALWPVLLLMRWMIALVAAVPGAVVHLPAPGAGAIILYFAALVTALVAWHARAERRRRRRLGTAAAALLGTAVLLAAWPAIGPADGRLRVAILDVGQGDAIVIHGPDGRTVLVDAGTGGPGRLDIGERVVAPYLWNHGVLRLAAAVVTHDDLDHAGGMPTIRRLFPVTTPWEARSSAPLALGGALITPLPGADDAVSRNDGSIVLRVEMGAAVVLLASDIEALTERQLAAAGGLAASVLKVAHHGSRTSSTPEFLAATRPAVAAISLGSRNPYGHPDPSVVERIEATGARLYRTDRDGAVVVETDGRVLTVTVTATGAVDRYCLDAETIC